MKINLNKTINIIITTLLLYASIIFIPKPAFAAADYADSVKIISESTYNEVTVINSRNIMVRLNLKDANGDGQTTINGMQISQSSDFSGAKSTSGNVNTLKWVIEGESGIKTIYARVTKTDGTTQDLNQSVIYDATPPGGGIAFSPRIIGPNAIKVTFYVGAEDFLSSVKDMQVADNPSFYGSVWEPIQSQRAIERPLESIPASNIIKYYAKFRDEAGNVSDVYSDELTVDREPPKGYVESSAGSTKTRTLKFYTYDNQSDVTTLMISNNPDMKQDVLTTSYKPQLDWTFDSRDVVWIVFVDAVDNKSEPYPVHINTGVPMELTPTTTPQTNQANTTTLTVTATQITPSPNPSTKVLPSSTPAFNLQEAKTRELEIQVQNNLKKIVEANEPSTTPEAIKIKDVIEAKPQEPKSNNVYGFVIGGMLIIIAMLASAVIKLKKQVPQPPQLP